MVEILYQLKPRIRTRWDYSGSFTQSIRSYDIGAAREIVAMKLYATIPNVNVRVNYLDVLSVEQIKDLWQEHSRNLQRAGIVGRVAIEITKNKSGTRPVNRIHYHFAIKDYLVQKNRKTQEYIKTPPKKHDEMMQFVKEVFLKVMRKDSIHVTHKTIDDWKGRGVLYFVKYKNRSNYLFQPLGLQKFYTINKKLWWTDEKGLQRKRKEIKEEMQQYAQKKTGILKGQVYFMLDLLDCGENEHPQKQRECRRYVIKKVNEWVSARQDCLSSGTWTSHGTQNKDFPKTLVGHVDFALYVLDCMGEEFNKEEYRHYIVDTVSEWANEV